jgi:hypothetical protein
MVSSGRLRRKGAEATRHKKRRKRSEKEGHTVFHDGSPYQWFGDEESTLLLSTDDATGNPLYSLF